MQERRRLPDGFLLMLLSHHFVVAFLVLTTFVVEPAVYNFMQTQKERKPCKIKASAANKRSARRRTRSGGPRTARTGAERRHRTFEPCQGSKKRTRPIWYRSFFQARDGDRSLFPRCKGFPTACPWKPCNGERSIRPLHWLLCFYPAKSWGAAVGGSITPNF